MFFDFVTAETGVGLDRKINIRLRNTIQEIPTTTYGTFAIYKYPAKFIPQVIAFVLKKYAKKGMKIFDPFGGYGTVGLVSRVYGYDYELWDLNPILKVIHDSATLDPYILKNLKIRPEELIYELKTSQKEFIPQWSNLYYWFPEEFLSIISKAWGFAHSSPEEIKKIIFIPLLKTTRYFSFSDEKIHKLYRSKFSKQKISNLLKKDWIEEFYNMLKNEISMFIEKLYEYSFLSPKSVSYKIKVGIDVLNTDLEEEVNILITSPPYLQAQEYIRSTKLELFWLGYEEEYIKELSKKEIPYNPVNNIKIYSETYYYYRNKIKENYLLKLYDRYFNAILGSFSKLGNKVKDYLIIFVGPAKIRVTSIPIDDIVIEHLKNFGWEHEITYIDEIVSRVMFESKSRINPASKLEDQRIKTEHLVVLKRV